MSDNNPMFPGKEHRSGISKPLGMRSDNTSSRELHKNDDVDISADSHHHTLGSGPGQAASGADVARLAASTFVGEIKLSARITVPDGWAICDGDILLREAYPELFAAISTTYNIGGEAATEFRIPNLRGRVVVQLDTSQAEFDGLGETGGSKTHTLTIAEMPSHTHLPDTNTMKLGAATWFHNAPTGPLRADPAGASAATGGGAAHNNLQPYMVLHYLIKLY